MGIGDIATKAKLAVERARARYGPVDIAVRTFKRFSEDDGGPQAAALTYYMFFSVFPLLIFSASVLGYLTFLSEGLRENLLTTGLEGVPLLGEILTPETLDSLQDRRGSLALLGLLLGLYSGSGAIVALSHSLNKINRVGSEPGFIPKRLGSLKWLAVLGGAAVTTLAMTGVVQALGTLIGDSTVVRLIVGTVLVVSSVGINCLIFATAFRFLTACETSWHSVLPGALFAAIAFELLKHVGAAYLASGTEGRNATFGAFATAAGLLVASYLLAQITLLAAELNAVMAERRATRRTSVAG